MLNNGNVGRSSAVILLLLSIGLVGCSTLQDDPHRRAKIGAGVGAVTGTVETVEFVLKPQKSWAVVK